MTGPVAPGSPGQEDAEEAPAPSPAMARAAKLNAANMARSLLPLLLICLALVGWQALLQSNEDRVREVDPTSSVRISAERAGYELVAPSGLPDGYRPTSARTTAGGAQDEEQLDIDGETWTRATTTRGETALTLEAGGATALVFGSASDEELTEVAAAVGPVG